MGTLIGLLIFVLIVVIALWLIDMLGLPPKSLQIVKIILLVIALLWLVQQFWHPAGGFYFR